MQLRLSNGSLSPFNGSNSHHPRKHKQRAIFTYNSRDQPTKNVYYDNNPYFLHSSPSDPHLKTLAGTSRNSSRSRECSDANSQRSVKVVRANGLKLVSKPSIGKIHEQSPVNGVRLNEQTRRMMHRDLELQAENKALRGQNQYLKQKIRSVEQSKSFEVRSLEEKIDYLYQMTEALERKVETAEGDWREQLRKLAESQLNDN